MEQIQLEKVTINDVLPFKTARRDAIANLKSFGASEHPRHNLDRFALEPLLVQLAP